MSQEIAFQYAFVIALIAFLRRPVLELAGAEVQDTVQEAKCRQESAQWLEKAALADFAGITSDPTVQAIANTLYRPEEARFDASSQPTTEDLIAKIELALANPSEWISTALPLLLVGPRLYHILHRAAMVAGASTSTNYYHVLTNVCAGYVDQTPGKAPAGVHAQVYQLFRDTLEVQVELHALGDSPASQHTVHKLREQGNNLMSSQAHPQAIQIYTEAIGLCDHGSAATLSQLYTNRAIAYIALNCFREAICDLNRALLHERSFTPAWTQLGYCHLYMGSSLTALQSYLIALKCLAGEVLPQHFDPHASIDEYKATKIRAILPQFVQRLCQSISLTEKRAYQQGEPLGTIRGIVSDVRRILAVLRSHALEADMEYFTFYPNIRDTMFRTISERMNRTNPGILTPEVTQNMLASTGTETIAIATPRDITSLYPGRRAGADDPATAPATTGVTTEEAVPVAPAAPSRDVPQPATRPERTSGIREMLNDFGDLMEGRIGRLSTEPADPGAGDRNDYPLRDALRGVLPDGLTNIISQFTGGQNRVFVNGREVGDTRSAPGAGETSEATDGREDQDMDIPDLD
ncbi:uncharacterized protein CANTADRAFT_21684 [Suhomyces tanzawaensis NRRL Y-17324]|uniref:Uncharacterized protein n=1 Tax=Suhomyces tanzawaensis NRRL Y-17324 TaxID=984487 RepID=A0A1E4SHA6_9ASCO|nr:uncharacterized protein CANTADRAFT_21684 [Suhomyces tanzawaensis NRRL Y-17324]ODV78891.1 hypothetical protein CANTADRAFT_21684 [Suhomyces tanzawaensis NRRL Y-17324]